MLALVQDGRVVATTTLEAVDYIAALEHQPTGVLIPCPDTTVLGDLYNQNDGTFSPPPTVIHVSVAAVRGTPTPLMVEGDLSVVTVVAGTALEVDVTLSVPLSTMFRMPLRSRDGRERILVANFVNGAATVNVTMRESGAWDVIEKSINEDLPGSIRMLFPGLRVFVVET